MITNELNTEQIKIFLSYSPAQELLISLHVMSNPAHHPATRDWALHKYEGLSAELREEIDFFSEQYADWYFIIDVMVAISGQAYPRRLTLEESVDAMLSMDHLEFSHIFLGLSAFGYSYDTLEKWMKDPDKITDEALGVQTNFLTRESVAYFLRDIAGMKRRLKWVINQYWNECFEKEWTSIEPYFENAVRKEELVLRGSNPITYIKDLHPKLSVEKDVIVFHKSPDYSVPIKNIKKILIIFSVFNAPHLSGNVIGDTMDVVKNLNFHSVKLKEDIPTGMFNVLYAASDQTRIRIMKILWNSDTTTKELAEVLELSPSTISLHLKVLKEAGLVESNKIKKFVYYRLKRKPLHDMPKGLIHYLEY